MPNTRRRYVVGFGLSREEFTRRLNETREGERVVSRVYGFPGSGNSGRRAQSQPARPAQQPAWPVAPPPYGTVGMQDQYGVGAGVYGPGGYMPGGAYAPGACAPGTYGPGAYTQGAYAPPAYGANPTGVNQIAAPRAPLLLRENGEPMESPPPYGSSTGFVMVTPRDQGQPTRYYATGPNSGPPFGGLTGDTSFGLPGVRAGQLPPAPQSAHGSSGSSHRSHRSHGHDKRR